MLNKQWGREVRAVFGALLLVGLVATPIWAWSSDAASAPANSLIETAFSPGPDAEQLVVKHLDSATTSIRLLAYSFTSAPVSRALIRAKKRGVDVAVAVDRRQNVELDTSGKARAALSALVTAGVSVRTVAAFAKHHDKVAVVDGLHVQTGSFNYSASASKSNSENALVVWNNSDLAGAYLRHWQRNWDRGQAFVLAY